MKFFSDVPLCKSNRKRRWSDSDDEDEDQNEVEGTSFYDSFLERQSVLDISKLKLSPQPSGARRLSTDDSLRRSVLICNTLRQLEGDSHDYIVDEDEGVIDQSSDIEISDDLDDDEDDFFSSNNTADDAICPNSVSGSLSSSNNNSRNDDNVVNRANNHRLSPPLFDDNHRNTNTRSFDNSVTGNDKKVAKDMTTSSSNVRQPSQATTNNFVKLYSLNKKSTLWESTTLNDESTDFTDSRADDSSSSDSESEDDSNHSENSSTSEDDPSIERGKLHSAATKKNATSSSNLLIRKTSSGYNQQGGRDDRNVSNPIKISKRVNNNERNNNNDVPDFKSFSSPTSDYITKYVQNYANSNNNDDDDVSEIGLTSQATSMMAESGSMTDLSSSLADFYSYCCENNNHNTDDKMKNSSLMNNTSCYEPNSSTFFNSPSSPHKSNTDPSSMPLMSISSLFDSSSSNNSNFLHHNNNDPSHSKQSIHNNITDDDNNNNASFNNDYSIIRTINSRERCGAGVLNKFNSMSSSNTSPSLSRKTSNDGNNEKLDEDCYSEDDNVDGDDEEDTTNDGDDFDDSIDDNANTTSDENDMIKLSETYDSALGRQWQEKDRLIQEENGQSIKKPTYTILKPSETLMSNNRNNNESESADYISRDDLDDCVIDDSSCDSGFTITPPLSCDETSLMNVPTFCDVTTVNTSDDKISMGMAVSLPYGTVTDVTVATTTNTTSNSSSFYTDLTSSNFVLYSNSNNSLAIPSSSNIIDDDDLTSCPSSDVVNQKVLSKSCILSTTPNTFSTMSAVTGFSNVVPPSYDNNNFPSDENESFAVTSENHGAITTTALYPLTAVTTNNVVSVATNPNCMPTVVLADNYIITKSIDNYGENDEYSQPKLSNEIDQEDEGVLSPDANADELENSSGNFTLTSADMSSAVPTSDSSFQQHQPQRNMTFSNFPSSPLFMPTINCSTSLTTSSVDSATITERSTKTSASAPSLTSLVFPSASVTTAHSTTFSLTTDDNGGQQSLSRSAPIRFFCQQQPPVSSSLGTTIEEDDEENVVDADENSSDVVRKSSDSGVSDDVITDETDNETTEEKPKQQNNNGNANQNEQANRNSGSSHGELDSIMKLLSVKN